VETELDQAWSAGSTPPVDRAEAVPRRRVGYWCANGHYVEQLLAVDVPPAALRDGPRCGLPQGQDEGNRPAPSTIEPYKPHLAHVTAGGGAPAAAILAEAMQRLPVTANSASPVASIMG
jgi:hypothetical protein